VNWDAVGALGEVVGAIAVVASIVYLAMQVRENTRSSRSATRQAISDAIVAANMIWAQSESFSQVFQDHLDGKELPEHQALQLSGYCYAYLRNWENVHYQYRSGMLSDEEWRGFRLNVKALLQVSAFRDFWAREREVFSLAFRREVEGLVGELPASPALMDSVLFAKSSAVERGE
jgi:hypothetical protein